jgi:hypothetical protein
VLKIYFLFRFAPLTGCVTLIFVFSDCCDRRILEHGSRCFNIIYYLSLFAFGTHTSDILSVRHCIFFLICIAGGGIKVHSTLRSLNGLLCQPRVIMIMEKSVE